MRLLFETPEMLKNFYSNSFNLKYFPLSSESMELIFGSKYLTRQFFTTCSLSLGTFEFYKLSAHTFERAIILSQLEPASFCEAKAKIIPIEGLKSIMSLAIVAKVWKKLDPIRFRQVKEDPMAQVLLGNKLLYARESIGYFVDYFTEETWETLRIFMSANEELLAKVQTCIHDIIHRVKKRVFSIDNVCCNHSIFGLG